MRLMPFGLPITRAYAAYLCRDRHHASLRPGVAVTRERPCLCSLTAHSPGPRILVAVCPHLLARSRARLRTTWRESSGLPEPPGERVLPGLFADAESLAEGEDAPGAGRRALVIYVVRKETPLGPLGLPAALGWTWGPPSPRSLPRLRRRAECLALSLPWLASRSEDRLPLPDRVLPPATWGQGQLPTGV